MSKSQVLLIAFILSVVGWFGFVYLLLSNIWLLGMMICFYLGIIATVIFILEIRFDDKDPYRDS